MGKDLRSHSQKNCSFDIEQWLDVGHLRFEKCELKEANQCFLRAFELAKANRDIMGEMRALVGLLRSAGEALDREAIQKWDSELDLIVQSIEGKAPAMVWFCKGAIAGHQEQWALAQRYYHRFLRTVRIENPEDERGVARGLTMLANSLMQRGHVLRARWIASQTLKWIETKKIKGVAGVAYLLMGSCSEREKEFDQALNWYQKAHAAFLHDHNWYHHLYVLYGYARLARLQKNYQQAYFYLDLIDKAAPSEEFPCRARRCGRSC